MRYQQELHDNKCLLLTVVGCLVHAKTCTNVIGWQDHTNRGDHSNRAKGERDTVKHHAYNSVDIGPSQESTAQNQKDGRNKHYRVYCELNAANRVK